MTPRETFARTMWAEARSEGVAGLADVGCSVRNRVTMDIGHDGKPDWWGEGYDAVCTLARRNKHGVMVWQYSSWNPADRNYRPMTEVTEADPQYRDALRLADEIMSGELDDSTNGATHYYDRRLPEPPAWAEGLTPCHTRGHHLFFNDVP